MLLTSGVIVLPSRVTVSSGVADGSLPGTCSLGPGSPGIEGAPAEPGPGTISERPALLDEPLRLRGRVKWIVVPADATDDSPAGMGIEFQYSDEAERTATEAIVESLMSKELGAELSAKLLGRKDE